MSRVLLKVTNISYGDDDTIDKDDDEDVNDGYDCDDD
jgi:hypothetical protein